MGWFESDSVEAEAHSTFTSYDGPVPEEHKAKFSHELIGGAAAYEAAKAYEDHVARNGRPDSHAKAKEIMAGLAGAFIDREFETKGLDFIDRERAKRHATERTEVVIDERGY